MFSNCQFVSADRFITAEYSVSDLLVTDCTFVPTGGTDIFGDLNTYATAGYFEVGIFVRQGGCDNLLIISNSYTGNCLLTSTNATAPTNWIGPDGLVFFQQAANTFIAHNIISNYALEAIQLASGPNSVVGNNYYTYVNDGAACGLCVEGVFEGVDGSTAPSVFSTTFIGNSVYGGRQGVRANPDPQPYTGNYSGNSIFLYPPFDIWGNIHAPDGPSVAFYENGALSLNVCGNTLQAGGYGVGYTGANDNAIILHNDFSAATYRGIGAQFLGDTLNNAQIFGNKLSEGVSFHAQLGVTNGFGWFLGNNTYMDSHSNTIPVFLDPITAPVHFSN
jgi:hypothetical protein